MKDFCIQLKDENMMYSDDWRKFIDHLNENLRSRGYSKYNGRDIDAYYGITYTGDANCSWDKKRGKEITLEQRINKTQKKFYIDI